MLSYRATLDVPFQLVLFVSRLLANRRHGTDTRRGTQALTCRASASDRLDSGGRGQTCSAPTPSGARLVASTRTRDVAESSVATSRAAPSSTCSQLSSTISALASAR